MVSWYVIKKHSIEWTITVQGGIVLHMIVHSNGAYGKCVLFPCVSNIALISSLQLPRKTFPTLY